MEQIKSLLHFYDLYRKNVTFYDSRKVPLWSGSITNMWGAPINSERYVSASSVQTFNKNGSKRKNSDGTGVKNKSQVFNIWYYSYGLVPENVQPEPAAAGVLTQAEVDAKLKEYVTKRITELTYYRDNNNMSFGVADVQNWHLDEAFVTIFRELTE